MSRRATENETVCAAFRKLLTKGFYAHDEDGVILDAEETAAMLKVTKAWRGDLWKAFRDLEDRLCPVKAFEEGRA